MNYMSWITLSTPYDHRFGRLDDYMHNIIAENGHGIDED